MIRVAVTADPMARNPMAMADRVRSGVVEADRALKL